MKSRGHIYMAHLIYDELLKSGGKLTLRTVPDADGKYETMSYQLEDPIYHAIKDHRGCFLAGSIGPDFFPDMLNGQMRIHPRESGKWLDMMFEELRKINPNTLEFQKAVAFYMGWLMHYCTDMYTHQYVNLHSYGWFPSISQIGSDAARLLNSPAIAALSQRIKGLLTDAELMDGDFEACLKRIMEDPVAVTELWDMITGSELRTEYGEQETAVTELVEAARSKLSSVKTALTEPELHKGTLVSALKDAKNAIKQIIDIAERMQKEEPGDADSILDKLTDKVQELVGFSPYGLADDLDAAIVELNREDAWLDKVADTIGAVMEELGDYQPQKFYIRLIEDAFHLLRMSGSILTIIRHLLVEMYLDNIIQNRLVAREAEGELSLGAYYAIDIPHDFIRRCFATPAAFQRMLKLSHDDTYEAKDNALDVLGKFVEYYEEEYRKMLLSGGDQQVLRDLEKRSEYLNMWVDFWRLIVENDLSYGSYFLEDEGSEMATLMNQILAAYRSADEEEIRDAEDFTNTVDFLEGLCRPLGSVGMILEKILFWWVDLLKEDLKEWAFTGLAPIACWLIEQNLVQHEKKIENFDDAMEVIKKAFENPRPLINCKLLFYKENLADQFDEEWKNLGRRYLVNAPSTPVNAFNLACPMLENAIQMGKLCLIGSHHLNELFRSEVADVYPFNSFDVRWSISTLLVEVVRLKGEFATKGYKLRLDVYRKDQSGKPVRFHSAVLWDAKERHPGRTIKVEIPLSEALTAQELLQCELVVERNDKGSMPRPNVGQATYRVNLYDKDSGLPLFSEQNTLYNQNGSSMKLLPPDQRKVEKTFREQYENAKLVNSLHRLRVTIEVGKLGTDKGVRFVVLGKNNGRVGPFNLDKGNLYDDFKAGITDSYDLELPNVLDVDVVEGFGLYSTDSDCDLRVNRVRVAVDVDGYGYFVTIASFNGNNRRITDKMLEIPLDRESLKAKELGLIREIRELQVDIRTGSGSFAGTDHDIFLEVMHNTRSLIKVSVNKSGRNDFERGKLDAVFVPITVNGKGIMSDQITQFRLSKEKASWQGKDDWKVDQVAVHDADSGILLGLHTTKPGDIPFEFTPNRKELYFSL